MANKKYKKKNNTLIVVVVVMAVVIGGWLVFKPNGDERSDNESIEIISRNGLHWHPQVSIRVKGEDVPIPANIGLVGFHNPIHTHDNDGVAHLEFPALVANSNLRMSEFFRVWGETFNEECIFDNCNGEGGQMRMMVNGEPNFEFHNYMMRDGDRIEIIYE
jgi:hypothetical protein